MKTTEIFVEQVLIGMVLVMIAGGILFGYPFLSKINSSAGFSASVIVLAVGAAYLSGIVYDRIADTFMANLEQHHRLWFGFKNPSWCGRDVFPEDQYRIRLLKDDNATDYVSYLRSRIRLTRALTTLAPAITIAAVTFKFEQSKGADWLRPTTLGLLVAAYALILIVKTRKTAKKPPKTHAIGDHDLYRKTIGFDADKEHPAVGILLFVSTKEFFMLATFGLLLVVFSLMWAENSDLGKISPSLFVTLCPAAGIALTVLSGWSWWRISQTFLRFLHDFHRVYPVGGPPPQSP